MTDISYDAFISYSRKDSEFVNQLILAIENHEPDKKRRIWQDVRELDSQRWWKQIEQNISLANNFLLVVSSNSLTSPYCYRELAYALQLNKRLVIVEYESVEKIVARNGVFERLLEMDNPQKVTDGNDMFALIQNAWDAMEVEQHIPIRNEADFGEKIPKVVEAFDKDLQYINQHTILLQNAEGWLKNDRNPSFLFRGSALVSLEKWRDSNKRPEPTVLQLEYIQTGRASEDADKRSNRRANLYNIISSVMFIAMILGLIIFVSYIFPIAVKTEIERNILAEFTSVLFGNDDPDIQLIRINQIVDKYSTEALASFARGSLYYNRLNYDQAIVDFSRTLELDPNYAKAYWGRGDAFYGQGFYTEAKADYLRYQELTGRLEDFMVERIQEIDEILAQTVTPIVTQTP